MIIEIKNLNKSLDVNYGATLSELAKNENIALPYPVLGALVNNQVRSLEYKIHKPCCVDFFDITSNYGNGIYTRSLYFMLFKSVKTLFPEAKLKILHSISGGKYCEIENLNHPLDESVLQKITHKIDELITSDLHFIRREVNHNET
jgi:uridine kinase